MAKSSYQSVDAYIAAQPAAAQNALQQVRRAIMEALGAAEEVISYGIPAYKLHGATLVYFAGWKRHYSLYPISDHLVAMLQGDVARYKVSKATLRFPLEEPVPTELIARIAKLRAKEAAERAPEQAGTRVRQRRS